jgi:hypothetical protein
MLDDEFWHNETLNIRLYDVPNKFPRPAWTAYFSPMATPWDNFNGIYCRTESPA